LPRVLVLAFHFPPIGGGGVQRNLAFVRYLPEHGYEPVVITGAGNAPERWTPLDRSMVAKIPSSTEVHRIPEPGALERSRWGARMERMLMLPSPFSRYWTNAVLELGSKVGTASDLIYASLVPYDSVEAAAALSSRLGIPWVADLQDPWALDEMWLYPTGLHRRRDLTRMRKMLSSSSAIVKNTPEATHRLLTHFPELGDKIVASIANGFDADDFRESESPREDGGQAFRIVHTGYLHTELAQRVSRTMPVRRLLGGMAWPVNILTRSHVYLLAAVDKLIRSDPSLGSVIEVHLAGVLSDTDRERAAPSSVVRLHGYLQHDESIRLVRSADLLFLPMHDLPEGIRAGLVPGKTYEYLASGKPVLAAVPDGDARDLLSGIPRARVCRPDDVDSMAAILADQIRAWRSGQSAKATPPSVLERFERRQLTAALADVFDRVLSVPARPEPAPHDRV
jgi:glycosyltransferase involved in cell wall biosynthesis